MRSFVKIKPSRNDEIILSFTYIDKSCLIREFSMLQIKNYIGFNAIRENKILEFTVVQLKSRKFGIWQVNMYFMTRLDGNSSQSFIVYSVVHYMQGQNYMPFGSYYIKV